MILSVRSFSKTEQIKMENPYIFSKIKFFFRKVITFSQVQGIVFFGGYPFPKREKDGYYQRIKAISDQFPDKWEIFIDRDPFSAIADWYERPRHKHLVLKLSGRRRTRIIPSLLTFLLVTKTQLTYYHSIYRVSEDPFFLNLPKVRKILDIHGVVPEEFRYNGDNESARKFEKLEMFAIRKSNYLITVTEEMKNYYIEKYPKETRTKEFIVLPIIPTIVEKYEHIEFIRSKPTVIYAGGLQNWQQIEKMIDAIIKTTNMYDFKFFCPDPVYIMEKLPPEILANKGIEIGSKPNNDILKVYKDCQYGFILREDNIVNRVACPTKLVEYLAMGVIPIVDSPLIGDFNKLGMISISLKDFISGNIPNEDNRKKHAQANFDVYQKILLRYQEGKKKLQKIILDNL